MFGGREKKGKLKKKIMPANSVHHCLSGCCYIPSVNNFFWEGNKISWNWTLNLDFCHSYAWDCAQSPACHCRLLVCGGFGASDFSGKSRLLTNTKFLLARFGRPDPEWWRQPRVCQPSARLPSRNSLQHISKHPLSGNFKEGEGLASQLTLAGWAF